MHQALVSREGEATPRKEVPVPMPAPSPVSAFPQVVAIDLDEGLNGLVSYLCPMLRADHLYFLHPHVA